MLFNRISQDSRISLSNTTPKHEDIATERIENIPAYKHGDAESLHLEKKITISDPVFGDIEENGPNYRNVIQPLQLQTTRGFEKSTNAA